MKDWGTADSDLMDRFPVLRLKREEQAALGAETEKLFFTYKGKEWFIEVPVGHFG